MVTKKPWDIEKPEVTEPTKPVVTEPTKSEKPTERVAESTASETGRKTLFENTAEMLLKREEIEAQKKEMEIKTIEYEANLGEERDIFNKAMDNIILGKTNIVLPTENLSENLMTETEVFKVIRNIASAKDITTEDAIALTFILFLKGAANKNAPGRLNSEILKDRIKIDLTKEELLYHYKTVTKNTHLRRMAECINTQISEFAEKYNYNGDLFQKINQLLTVRDQPLSAAERAWCSSFNQKNMDCLKRYQRVYTLLAVEYTLKFKTKIKANPNSTKAEGKNQKKSANPRKNKKK